MKKISTFILCWLLAFQAFASGVTNSYNVGTTLAVSGGYLTSQNKIDGSFESSTSGWSASVGTIVKTASTEIQGNNLGVWSGTGTGTLDLQWTATASNTFDGNAFVNVGGEDDVYVCAYVGTTETGCKLIPALDKIQKVSVIADSKLSEAFYLRLKHTGSDAFSVKVDDGKIEPQAFQNVQVVTQQGYRISQANNAMTDITNELRFNLATAAIVAIGNDIFTIADDSTNGRTTFTFKKKSSLIAVVGAQMTATNNLNILRNGVNESSFTSSAGTDYQTTTFSGVVNAGDIITVNGFSKLVSNINPVNLSLEATAISDNVIQSYQDGTEWTSYTPTFNGFGSPSGIQAEWKRIGSDLHIRGRFVSGTATAVEASVGFPSGLTSAGTSSIPTLELCGYATFGVSSGIALTVLCEPSVSYITFGGQGSASNGLSKAPGSGFSGSSVAVAFYARIPIAGWSSSPTLYAMSNRAEVFSSDVSAGGVVSNATNNFVTSCTNAAPSVCSLWSSFGVAPKCWTHTLDITKRAEVTATTATTVTVARTDTATAFNLFCHLK